MKRLKKAVLLPIRYLAYRFKFDQLYYWAESRVFELRQVKVMPDGYYCWMYRVCMQLVKEKRCIGLADWMIHRIPYDIRCNLA